MFMHACEHDDWSLYITDITVITIKQIPLIENCWEAIKEIT